MPCSVTTPSPVTLAPSDSAPTQPWVAQVAASLASSSTSPAPVTRPVWLMSLPATTLSSAVLLDVFRSAPMLTLRPAVSVRSE
ncbi:hypothetical protein [Chitinimonas koreensis]|uniref:hypothetical protein n=1 Tax=Chitinimonas koreensis TaxID=356302 RepID=UPI0016540767|nr:hypothetical protein [Chitinimonas koreensis]QNM97682.1 hypothetical protein H9L41_05135 [Chitinimonas koreensis]